ncbi:MAG: hypothetical protein KDI32_12840 [Pseudomonadales bacterium]|nr:hypothetical protein [Pseudomonadales bacterium]
MPQRSDASYFPRYPALTASLALLAMLGLLVAFFGALTGDAYKIFAAIAIGMASLGVGIAAILSWVWSMPWRRAMPLVAVGTVLLTSVCWGAVQWIGATDAARRIERQAAAERETARQYLHAPAYSFTDVDYDPRANRLIARRPNDNGTFSNMIFVVPFSDEVVLIVQDNAPTYLFDGKSSSRVVYDGHIEQVTDLTAGHFVYHGKRYAHPDLRYDIESGDSAAHSDGALKLPRLVAQIAPDRSAFATSLD